MSIEFYCSGLTLVLNIVPSDLMTLTPLDFLLQNLSNLNDCNMDWTVNCALYWSLIAGLIKITIFYIKIERIDFFNVNQIFYVNPLNFYTTLCYL